MNLLKLFGGIRPMGQAACVAQIKRMRACRAIDACAAQCSTAQRASPAAASLPQPYGGNTMSVLAKASLRHRPHPPPERKAILSPADRREEREMRVPAACSLQPAGSIGAACRKKSLPAAHACITMWTCTWACQGVSLRCTRRSANLSGLSEVQMVAGPWRQGGWTGPADS